MRTFRDQKSAGLVNGRAGFATPGVLAKRATKLLALAAFLLPAAPAWSAVYTVDWTGVIYDGDDATGVFGRGASLIGKTVDLRFRVDTAAPGAIRQDDAFGTLIGGHDAPAPITASVTIDGITFQMISHEVYVPADPFTIFVKNEVAPNDAYAYESDPVPNLDRIGQGADQVDNIQVFSNDARMVNIFNNYVEAEATSYFTDIADGDVETAPLSHVFTIDDENVFASFRIGELFEETYFDGRSPQVFYENSAFGRFIPSSVTVTPEGAGSGGVPEPATWAMMLAGFGIVGGAIRRRRRSHASAPGRRLGAAAPHRSVDRILGAGLGG